MLTVKVSWESKIALGAECRTGQGKFESKVCRLQLGLV